MGGRLRRVGTGLTQAAGAARACPGRCLPRRRRFRLRLAVRPVPAADRDRRHARGAISRSARHWPTPGRPGSGWTPRPEVVSTAGSVANLVLLAGGDADVAFCAADAAADAAAGPSGTDLRALARIYDDVVHVVGAPRLSVTALAGLRGMRVSVGAPDSGVAVISTRLLPTAGIDPRRDMAASQLGINDSAAAMRDGRIDAFFWSGGLPTPAVSEPAAGHADPVTRPDRPDRDRCDSATPSTRQARCPPLPTASRSRSALCSCATSCWSSPGCRTTWPRRWSGRCSSPGARLAQASEVARTIDQRTAIGTQPIALHPGRSATTGPPSA